MPKAVLSLKQTLQRASYATALEVLYEVHSGVIRQGLAVPALINHGLLVCIAAQCNVRIVKQARAETDDHVIEGLQPVPRA